jgi:hypothetical protein
MPNTLFELHPSVPRTQYMGSGRGGAGNMHRVSKKDIFTIPANPPASRTTLPPPPTTFMTGRGGAGNLAHAPSSSERAIFSFDEELIRDQRAEERQAPVYYIGRGGAGNYSYSRGRNWSWEQNRSTRSNSVSTQSSRETIDSNLSDRSDRSVGSKMGNAWTRFSQTLKGQT